MFESLVTGAQSLVSSIGPAGVFLAMFVETIFPPIPSELVMPLAGYIAFTNGSGLAGLLVMILVGTAGSTLGAWMIYEIAKKGGRPLVLKYGKRFMLDEKKLRLVEKWFANHGHHAVFLCRMAPGLRELVSIPAGLAKMHFGRFIVLTFAGSLVWSAFLGSLGYFLSETVANFSLEKVFNIVAVCLVGGLAAVFAVREFRKNGAKKGKKRA